jgi:hypothetical protein
MNLLRIINPGHANGAKGAGLTVPPQDGSPDFQRSA